MSAGKPQEVEDSMSNQESPEKIAKWAFVLTLLSVGAWIAVVFIFIL